MEKAWEHVSLHWRQVKPVVSDIKTVFIGTGIAHMMVKRSNDYVIFKQSDAVITRYNDMILHTSLQRLGQDLNKIFSPQKLQYGMSFVRILEKIDCVMRASHCTCKDRLYVGAAP